MAAKGEENTGVILKIQKRSGCLLLVIGAAMLAFVLTDIISGMGRSIGMKSNVVGEIAGEDVSLEEYNAMVDLELAKYERGDPNRQITDEFMSQVREQVWNKMIEERIFHPQYETLGIGVFGQEIYDGALRDEQIRRAFADSMGVFHEDMFMNFLQVTLPENEDVALTWTTLFEDPLIQRLRAEKYATLLNAGVYATTVDAEADFEYRNKAISAKIVGLPFLTIPDSAISYTDNDLLAFMQEHEDDYKQDAFVNIEFAVMDIRPSAEDSAEIRRMITNYAEGFKKAENDSVYVANHESSYPYNSFFLSPGDMDNDEIDELLFSADSGDLIGPMLVNGAYTLYKISDTKEDTVPSVRARHILLRVVDGDTAATITKGRDLIKEIKDGKKNFEDEAIGNIDRTGPAGGDLGWMKKGIGSVDNEDVRKAIFKGNYKKGDMFVTTSSLGVHVVEITSDKVTRRVKVAIVDKPVTFSPETSKRIEKIANEIFFNATDAGGDFRDAVQAAGYNVNEETGITEKDDRIPGIKLPKTVVRWLYDEEREVSDVSDPFYMRDQFVIVKVVKIAKEGLPAVDDVRERLVMEYRNEKKGEMLAKQLEESLKKVDNLDDLAKEQSTQVRIVPHSIMQENTITGIGVDTRVLGHMFGMEYGKMSKPVIGSSGVYVIVVDGEVAMEGVKPEFNAEEAKDMVRREIAGGAVEQVTADALRKKYNVVDNRFRFF